MTHGSPQQAPPDAPTSVDGAGLALGMLAMSADPRHEEERRRCQIESPGPSNTIVAAVLAIPLTPLAVSGVIGLTQQPATSRDAIALFAMVAIGGMPLLFLALQAARRLSIEPGGGRPDPFAEADAKLRPTPAPREDRRR